MHKYCNFLNVFLMLFEKFRIKPVELKTCWIFGEKNASKKKGKNFRLKLYFERRVDIWRRLDSAATLRLCTTQLGLDRDRKHVKNFVLISLFIIMTA